MSDAMRVTAPKESHVEYVEYEAKAEHAEGTTGEMTVKYRDGKVYRFYDVPGYHITKLMRGNGKKGFAFGSYVNRYISAKRGGKPLYRYELVEGGKV